jgi:predicted transcriptional regulator
MVKKKKPATKKKLKAKRPAAKKAAAKKTVGKKAPPKKRAAKKSPAKRPAPKKKPARKSPGGVSIAVSPALDARLAALAASMNLSLDALVLQALAEFADTWEDHQRTVEALGEEDDRMQLVVPPQE